MKIKTIIINICVLLGISGRVCTQISLPAFATPYNQDFNTLVNTGTSTSLPLGWFISETGTAANTLYTAGTGSSNTGDTYSFGATASTERCLGGLFSGSLTPSYGANFTNNTGGIITSLQITYTGETWRVGSASRSDQINFSYSLNATSMTTGTWTNVASLNYANPGQALGSGSMQHSSNITFTITGLSIVNGNSFWVKWIDTDAAGADDGMGIDDFSITPFGIINSIATGAITGSPFNTTCTTGATGTIDFTSVGTYNAGNTYTVQMSDASGSFTNPVNIGSLTSTANSGTINFTIPPAMASGVNYIFRIVSSNPSVTSNNTANQTITRTGSCTQPYMTSTIINSCQTGACTEGQNELIFGRTGNYSVRVSPANLRFMYDPFTPPTTSYTDILVDVSATTTALNTEAGCPGLFVDGFNSTIPPNAPFIIAHQSLCTDAMVWSSLCGSGPIYVIYSNDPDWNTSGNFTNSTTCSGDIRHFQTNITNTFGEVNVINYSFQCSLNSGTDGDYAQWGPTGGPAQVQGDNDCNLTPVLLSTGLVSFSGRNHGTDNELYWLTDSEENNDYFTIKHSVDGIQYEKIAQIAGSGTSQEQNAYNFIHSDPKPGINYYSLYSTDYDGTTYLKGTVALTVKIKTSYYNTQTHTIEFNKTSDVEIYTPDGKLILKSFNVNSIPFNQSGIYIIKNLRTGTTERIFIP